MSELYLEIQEMLESDESFYYISKKLDIPLSWVQEVNQDMQEDYVQD
jgi:hypothetical protein